MSEIEGLSVMWDRESQLYSSWEPNELNYSLLTLLEPDDVNTNTEISFFDLQKKSGWQEGRLWKTMNDLVSMCGEI